MVGDGVNDAPTLVDADLAIAIGAGTDVAVESVSRSATIRVTWWTLALSRANCREMIQNFALAAGIACPWGVFLTPAAGAALMLVGNVLVAINGKFLERAKTVIRTGSGE